MGHQMRNFSDASGIDAELCDYVAQADPPPCSSLIDQSFNEVIGCGSIDLVDVDPRTVSSLDHLLSVCASDASDEDVVSELFARYYDWHMRFATGVSSEQLLKLPITLGQRAMLLRAIEDLDYVLASCADGAGFRPPNARPLIG